MKTTTHQQKMLYGVLAVVVIVLVVLIGWFIYLLVKPADTTDTATNDSVVNNTTVTNQTNKNTNATNTNVANANSNGNTNSNANNNTNSNSNSNTNTNATESDEAGLVEPDEDSNSNNNTNSSAATGPTYSSSNTEATTATLYFAKQGGSCGDVVAVQRDFTAGDDPFGQIILDDMRGPISGETGMTDGIPSTIRLRQVQYTADGSTLTVNEAYNDLSDCDKKTVDAQLIKTANVMFDVSPEADGKVVVGEVSTEDTNTNTNE